MRPRSFALPVLLCLTACSEDPAPSPPRFPVTRVIIVGAGMSGLTTGHALAAAGIDVLVLEARDRIGGRTHTEDVAGTPVDIGGAWIHGARNNPLVSISNAYGLAHIRDDNEDVARVVSAEHGVYEDDVVADAVKETERLLVRLPRYRARLGRSASVALGIDAYFDDRGILEHDLARFIAERAFFELNYAAPTTLQSLEWALEEPWPKGGDRILIGGYRTLIDRIAEGVPVRLGETVTRIERTAEGVVVHATSGTFVGSHVVVSVPVNVLRAERIEFVPALPDAKREALARLDMGNLEKVILRFDEVFWDEIKDSAGLVVSSTPGEMPSFVDMTASSGAPTLVCFYGGQYARDVQATLNDAQIVAIALESLERLLGRDIPEPIGTFVSRWTSDPLSGGSYAFIPVGGSPTDMEILAEPVEDRIFFAGEATAFDTAATVHGAFLSGVRVARELGVRDPSISGF